MEEKGGILKNNIDQNGRFLNIEAGDANANAEDSHNQMSTGREECICPLANSRILP